jgi:hypothetical protein
VPTPQPTGPTIDPALRQRANGKLTEANAEIAAAERRNASASPRYGEALRAVGEANTKLATAKSNDDLNTAIALAENAVRFAKAATAPAVATSTTAAQPTKPKIATEIVLGDTAKRLRQAFQSYFNGDFEDASSRFSRLSQEMPKNGWIWAFLGASQYSSGLFDADESLQQTGIQSFRKAKQLRTWGRKGLPEKYFSKRIRRVFENAG